MTTLTLELPPHLYERLRQEATRQGKPEQEVVQALLAERLTPTVDTDDVPLAVQMTEQIRALIGDKTIDDFVVHPRGTPEDAIALLRAWNEEDAVDPDDEGESWEDVLRSLDANRGSYRKLFPELER